MDYYSIPSSGESLDVHNDSGIYGLSGVSTHYIYTGRTVRMIRRGKENLWAASNQRHPNPNVRAICDVFGPEELVWIVIEAPVDPELLPQKEDEWISRFQKEGRALNKNKAAKGKHNYGYKLSPETRQRQSEAKSGSRHPNFGKKIPVEKTRACRYRFCAPDGKIVETLGLKALAQEYGLNVSHLWKVANGRAKQHWGFTKAPDEQQTLDTINKDKQNNENIPEV